jgi:hypothetical protein
MDQDSSDEERTASAHHHPEKEAEVDRQKQDAIRAACHDADVSALQRLAESEGGFLTDSLRQLACTYGPLTTTPLKPYSWLDLVHGLLTTKHC